MASLYFHFATMNAGKSSALIQAAYNYKERGMDVVIFKPRIDNRDGDDVEEVTSRIGLKAQAKLISSDEDLFEKVCVTLREQQIHCVFVDEAQFLTPEQVRQLAKVVDVIKLPVLTYGLRSDFQGNLFPGSAALFATAQKLRPMVTICHCGSRATHVLRYNEAGDVVKEGPQVEIGGNDRYVAVCRKHHAGPMGYYD